MFSPVSGVYNVLDRTEFKNLRVLPGLPIFSYFFNHSVAISRLLTFVRQILLGFGTTLFFLYLSSVLDGSFGFLVPPQEPLLCEPAQNQSLF